MNIEQFTKVLASAQGNPTPARPGKVCAYTIQAALAAIPVERIDSGELDWFAQMVHDVVHVLEKPMIMGFYFEFMGGLCSEDPDFEQAEATLGSAPIEFEFWHGNRVYKLPNDHWLVKWGDEGINGFWLCKVVAQ